MYLIRKRSEFLGRNLKTILRIKDIIHFMVMNIDSEYTDIPEIHDFWEMVYLESGEAVAIANDTEIKLTSGDLIFHHPEELHSIKAVNGTTAKVFFISFHSTGTAAKMFNSLKLSLETKHKNAFYKLYDEARSIYICRELGSKIVIFSANGLSSHAPIGAQQLIKNHLEEFLISLLQHMENKKKVILYDSKEEFEEILFQKIVEKLINSIYSVVTIESLCTEFNCGKTFISNLFKKKSGMTIIQYFTALKINEAKRLIEEGNISLTDISEKLSFSDLYYFSKVFKKVIGVTPSNYKQKHNENP